MADYNTKPPDKTTADDGGEKKRWQKILDLAESARLYDLSTGQVYTRGQFKPLHRNEFENLVDEFAIIGTDERVFVAFLRVIGDKKRCSLTLNPERS